MKHSNIFKYVAGVAVLGFMTSCNDFLDQEPMSSVSPEKYLKDESQLEAYANNGGYASHGHAICANCGKEAKVPFKPREDRPVYCSECFASMRGEG